MNLDQLLTAFLEDLSLSLRLFGPELSLCGTIVFLLLGRLIGIDRRIPPAVIAIAGAAVGMGFAAKDFVAFYNEIGLAGEKSFGAAEFFTGLMVFDSLTIFFRAFLMLFLLFVLYMTVVSGIPDREDAPDFYVMLLGSTLGMLLMCGANHLLMVFIAVEMASVPSYAMVGFLKGRKPSSEAALKYVVYGSGASGVMLYGISLLCGLLGTAHLPSMAAAAVQFGAVHNDFITDPTARTLLLGVVMILVGVAFKLSAFPFHFWCPDAFEGASAEVGGFLSVASKGAAFAVLIRVCIALTGGLDKGAVGSLSPFFLQIGIGLGVISVLTMTYGNLTAYFQNNVKRLLAYSTIAQAGYMLGAVAALMVVLSAPAPEGSGPQARMEAAVICIQSVLFYLTVYFFMNLGAFAVVAVIRNQLYSEDIQDYGGLASQSPWLCVCLLMCLISLVGIPPFGGAWGKLMVFGSIFNAGAYHWSMYVLLAFGGLNTAVSLFYYYRVFMPMFLRDPLPGARKCVVEPGSSGGILVTALSVPVLVLGVYLEPVSRTALYVAQQLLG
jgi:NADH-quinone oxidoreductase subunit N